ncbi:MAG: cytidine deaminase [Oceanospirillaceae bacterium]|nr:cytidine deaminase [Oceanospirillaceae bacterium]
MNIEDELYQSVVGFIESRYPIGWGGAAAVRTESGKILISVAPETKNDALALCMEVGALLEAHKLNEAVTHSICVCREDEHSELMILSPCGVCQERLVHWGGKVKAAVSSAENTLVFKTIRELMPYHWSIVNGEQL